MPCVYSSCTASSRTTVYPPGTYLRRPVHVYLLHGCSSQFALRPLDFRRGAFDARNNFFFSLLLFPTPTILSLWPRPVRRTKRGRWRDRARWLKGGGGREGGTIATRRRSFFRDVSIFWRGTERNSFRGRVFIEAMGKWGTISILFFLFEIGFLENFWINKLVRFVSFSYF